jgi:hypothetical protein
MTGCEQVQGWIEQGETETLSPDFEEHLAQCEVCNTLVQGRASDDAMALTWADMNSVLQRERRSLLSRVRVLATPWRYGLAITLMLGWALGEFAMHRRADFDVYPRFMLFAVWGAFAGLAAAMMIAALQPLHRAEGPSKRTAALLGFAVALPVLVGVLPQPHGAPVVEGSFAALASNCFFYGLLVSVPVLLGLWLLSRTGVNVSGRVLLGTAAAGLVGNLALQIHCSIANAAHQICGHGPVLIFLLMIAAAWIQRQGGGTKTT